MTDDLTRRGINLALGTWRDTALRDLREARKRLDAAYKAAEAGNPEDAAHEASEGIRRAAGGLAAVSGWKGAAETTRMLGADEGTAT